MDTFRTAILFYRDGQVKFTNVVVENHLRYYQEAFVPPLSYQDVDEKEKVKNSPFYTHDFVRQGDVFGYAIYKEI